MGLDEQLSKNDTATGHLPVMLGDVQKALGPITGLRIVDGTFGAGGYTRALLAQGAQVIAIDRDPNVQSFVDALKQEFADRFNFVAGTFSDLDELVTEVSEIPVDVVVLDIGVSSMQLDQAERGFSFMRDGPLDMRMSHAGQSAGDIINTYDEVALADLIFTFGEERKSRRIAKAIVMTRDENPIETTLQLANLIEKTIGRKPGSNHPATRTFQALRIAVNCELDELVEGLFAAERLLGEGARLLVVTFHSLEDRIVKRFFDSAKIAGQQSRHMPPVQIEPARWAPVAKAIKPSKQEVQTNPRSRSAILRIARRTGHEARETSYKGLGVPGSKVRGVA